MSREKAFPNSKKLNQDGMDLRDWFAGMALQGLLACSSVHENDVFYINNVAGKQAEWAYHLADMMIERKTNE